MNRFALVLLVSALVAAPALADVNPLYTGAGTPFVTSDPGWITGIAAAHLVAPMDPVLIGPPTNPSYFTGTVDSWVYFLNSTDSSGGLGFVYQFSVTTVLPPGETGLVRATFATDEWPAYLVSRVGSWGAGLSTAYGVGGWTNGSPQAISLGTTQAPIIQFNAADTKNGTSLNAGNSSSLIWFETNAKSWKTSVATLQDGAKIGSVDVLIVPAPAAVLLGAMGLGLVGWVKRRFA